MVPAVLILIISYSIKAPGGIPTDRETDRQAHRDSLVNHPSGGKGADNEVSKWKWASVLAPKGHSALYENFIHGNLAALSTWLKKNNILLCTYMVAVKYLHRLPGNLSKTLSFFKTVHPFIHFLTPKTNRLILWKKKTTAVGQSCAYAKVLLPSSISLSSRK